MRLIDGDSLEKSICQDKCGLEECCMTFERDGAEYCLEVQRVKDSPTIDAKINEDKHGEWLFEEYPDGYYHSKCSLCNSWFSEDAFLNPYKYCPNCGACMIKQGDITTEQGDITTKRLDIPTMDEVNDEAN